MVTPRCWQWLFALLPRLAAGDSSPPPPYSETWRAQVSLSGSEAGLQGKWTGTSDLPVYISVPDPTKHRLPAEGYPVVLVAHHAVGVYHATFLREFCDALADEGYFAVLPDLFHRVWSDAVPTGYDMPFDKMNIGAMLQSQKDEFLLKDLADTFAFVSTEYRGHANAALSALLGFCMGGRIAWLASSADQLAGNVKAAVAYHGGNVWKAYGSGKAPGERLDSVKCPVLGHFGELDTNPSLDDMKKLSEGMEALGKEMEYYTYPDARHGFSCRDSSYYQEEAATSSWKRTIDFLGRHLKAGKQEL